MTTPQPMTPPPPPGGFTPGWQPSPPSGLMWTTIGLTGGVALISILSALAFDPDSLDEALRRGQQASGVDTLLGSFSNMLMIGAYITLALWMTAVHKNLVSRGVAQPLAPIWAWFAWFVPLANFVLPAMYMNGLNKRTGSWALWPWWLAWCGYFAVQIVFGFTLFGAVFSSVSENSEEIALTADQLDMVTNAVYITTALVVVAFVFLAKFMKDVTDTHLSESAGADTL